MIKGVGMNGRLRKIVCTALAAALLCTSVDVSVFAQGNDGIEETEGQTILVDEDTELSILEEDTELSVLEEDNDLTIENVEMGSDDEIISNDGKDDLPIFGGGSGTYDKPYLIYDYKDLNDIHKLFQKPNSGGRYYFKQMRNITANEDIDDPTNIWEPVSGNQFVYYDGNGFTISNLYIEGNGRNVAMFEEAGTFTDTILDNIVVKRVTPDENVELNCNMATMAEQVYRLNNCTLSGNAIFINDDENVTRSEIGGLAINVLYEMDDCRLGAKISGRGEIGNLGGLAARSKVVTGCSVLSGAGIIADANIAGICFSVSGELEEAGMVSNCYTCEDAIIESTSEGGEACGVVYDCCYSDIDNCANAATISADRVSAGIGYSFSDGKMTNCINTGKLMKAQYRAGIVFGVYSLGYTQAVVSNCVNEADIDSGDVKNKDVHVAGIVDRVSAEVESEDKILVISDNENRGNLTGSHGGSAAGIAGDLSFDIEIKRCFNFGSIQAGNYAAGIVNHTGSSESNTRDLRVINCGNEGTVTSESMAGGIVNSFGRTQIVNCYNSGAIFGKTVGGIAADQDLYNRSSIIGCANTGRLSSDDSHTIGGIVGEMGNGIISQCSNKGEIISERAMSGGILGYAFLSDVDGNYKENRLTVSDCYNAGSISETDINYYNGVISGLIGEITPYCSDTSVILERCYNVGSLSKPYIKQMASIACISFYEGSGTVVIRDNYYLQQADIPPYTGFNDNDGDFSGYGFTSTACTADQMKSQATYSGWDFDTVWEKGDSKYPYPVLRNIPGATRTVTFDANGGTFGTENKVTRQTNTGGQLTSLPRPDRSGKMFVGWYTKTDDGTRIDTTTVFEENTTVYAHWKDYDPSKKTAISGLIPENGATGVPLTDGHNFRYFVLRFKVPEGKQIQGLDPALGSMRICRYSDGRVDYETLKTSEIKISSDKRTIELVLRSGALKYNTRYYVEIDGSYFNMSDPDDYIMITDKDEWTFTTEVSDKQRKVIFDPGEGSMDGAYTEMYTDEKGMLDDLPSVNAGSGRYFGGWFTGKTFGFRVSADDNFKKKVNYTDETDMDTAISTKEPLYLYARYFGENELRYYDDMANALNKLKYLCEDSAAEEFFRTLSYETKFHHVMPTYEDLKDKTGGICYGASTVMAAMKATRKDVLGSLNVSCFNELDFNDEKVRNLLTMYHLTQYTNAAFNEKARFGHLSPEDKLRDVVAKAEGVSFYGPAVLVLKVDKGYHAIVIDGLDKGDVTVKGNTYYYTVKTYDINEKEGLNESYMENALNTTGYYPRRVDPSKSYVYISKDFKKWTIRQESLYKRAGEPMSAGKLKMCFNDDFILNACRYYEPALNNDAKFIKWLDRDEMIGLSEASVTVDGKTVELSNLEDEDDDNDGDLFAVGDIAGEGSNTENIFLPKTYSSLSLDSGDGSLSVVLSDAENAVSVSMDSAGCVKAGNDFSSVSLSGKNDEHYKGRYSLNLVLDDENGSVLDISGTLDGVAVLTKQDEDYVLSTDGNQQIVLKIGEEGSESEYKYVGERSLKIQKQDSNDKAGVYVDTDGDGNYEKKLKEKVNGNGDVLPEDIPSDGNIPEGIWIAGAKPRTYDGTTVTVDFRIYDNETLLVDKTDYTVTYKNNKNAYTFEDADKLTDAQKKKAPQAIIKMKGNYSGQKVLYFCINPLSINDEAAFEASVKKGKKTVIFKYNDKALKENVDYTVGSVTDEAVTVTGKGNFTGTHEFPLTTKEGITNVSMSKVIVDSIPTQFYTGTALTVDTLKGKDGSSSYAVKVSYPKGTELTAGKDYMVAKIYNSVNAGTATVVLKGLKAGGTAGASDKYSFTGEKRIKFKIDQCPMDRVVVTGSDGSKNLSAVYRKSGAKPEKLMVAIDGRTLKEGRDYTVKYSANTKYTGTGDKSAKDGKLTVTGRGNYKGSKSVVFTITRRPFTEEAGINVNAADMPYVNKAGKFMSDVKVYDSEGKLLKAGIDYEKVIKYVAADGSELSKASVPEEGNVITVIVTGKGGYTSDTISADYKILKAGEVNDISKAKISIDPVAYRSGRVILTGDNASCVHASMGKDKKSLSFSTDGIDGDFMVLPGSYENNDKKGTAKVTFVGINNYSGSKTVTVKIGTRSLMDWWRG